MKVCRICLSKAGRLYPLTSNGLRSLYHQLTGVLKLEADLDKKLPQWVCAECGLRLLSYNKLRQKSLTAHQILTDLLNEVTHITDGDIDQIDRENNNLKSNLKYALSDNMIILDYVADIQESNITVWTPENPAIKVEEINIAVDGLKIEKEFAEEFHETAVAETFVLEPVINTDSESDLQSDQEEACMSSDSASSVKKLIKTLSSKTLKTEHKKVLSDLKEKVDSYAKSLKNTSKKGVKRTGIKKEVIKKEKRVKKVNKTVKKDVKKDLPVATGDDVFTVQQLTLEEQKWELEKRKDYRTYINAEFKCNYCYRGFDNKTVFTRHNLMHTSRFGKLECKVCKRRFRTMHSYTLHVAWHQTAYNCKDCKFRTDSRAKIILHHRSSHQPKSYKCPHCREEFNATSSYFLHLRVKHASGVACELCGMPFINAKGLEQHKNRKHALDLKSKIVSPDGPACVTCNITFVSYKALDTHTRLTHNHKAREKTDYVKRRSIICELCGVESANAAAYKQHFRAAHPNETPTNVAARPFMCDQCGAVFQVKNSLKQHAAVHAQETPYECDHCKKRYKSKPYLWMHITAVHLPKKEKFYPCGVCGKIFNKHNNRRRHMVTHSNARPFNCEICGSSFKTKQEVKAHTKHVHLKAPWPRKNKKEHFQHPLQPY